MDKRKKHYLIFDTETTGSTFLSKNGKEIMQKLIYDIGWNISTKKGNEPILKKNYIVKEIYTDEYLMNQAYFKCKIPSYNDLISKGNLQVRDFKDIIKELQNDIILYDVQVIGAYNISFDLDALMQTTNFIYPNKYNMIFKLTKNLLYAPDTIKFNQKYIFKKDLQIWDIWTLACQTLARQKTFKSFYAEYTSRGNIRTNAEIMYNYIEDLEGEFLEDHTALSDSIIETKILQRILKNNISNLSKMEYFPYRLAQKN